MRELPGGRARNTLKITPILIIDKENLFKPCKEDLKAIDGIIKDYEKYADVLPPKKYMEMLNKSNAWGDN